MGTDMGSVQSAYQGFAKQNYTMLDNLKLGYGGTASEMARLINDSGVLGDAVEVTADTLKDVPFDVVIDAIGTIQDEMGITGTTAAEASTTLQGSATTMQAAWSNLLTGMASGENMGMLISNLTDSIVTFIGNLVPVIADTVPRVVEGISQLVTNLAPMIPEILNTLLPSLIEGATSLLTSFVTILPDLLTILIDVLPQIVDAVMT